MTKSPRKDSPAKPSATGAVRQTNALAGAMKTVGGAAFRNAGSASEAAHASARVNALSANALRVSDIASGAVAHGMMVPLSSAGAVADAARGVNALQPLTSISALDRVNALASGVDAYRLTTPFSASGAVADAARGVNAFDPRFNAANKVVDLASGVSPFGITTPSFAGGGITDIVAGASRPFESLSEASKGVATLVSRVEPFGITTPLSASGGVTAGRISALQPSSASMLSSAATASNALQPITHGMISASALTAQDASTRALVYGGGAVLPPPSYARAPVAPPTPAPARKRIGKVSDIGELVRDRRLALGLTQQDLADAAGTGRRFISELEGGKPTLEFGKVLTVCRCVGVDLSAVTR